MDEIGSGLKSLAMTRWERCHCEPLPKAEAWQSHTLLTKFFTILIKMQQNNQGRKT